MVSSRGTRTWVYPTVTEHSEIRDAANGDTNFSEADTDTGYSS